MIGARAGVQDVYGEGVLLVISVTLTEVSYCSQPCIWIKVTIDGNLLRKLKSSWRLGRLFTLRETERGLYPHCTYGGSDYAQVLD